MQCGRKGRSPGKSGASIDRDRGGGTTWGIGKTRSCDLSEIACLSCDTAARRQASGWLPTLDAEPNQPGGGDPPEPEGWL